MKNRKWLATPLALTLCTGLGLGLSSAAHAQRAPDRAQNRAERRQQIEKMTPEQRQQFMQQRMAQMQQRREEQTRTSLTAVGVTDKTEQDAIVEFMKAQDKARMPLREMGRKLGEALQDKDVTDEELTAQIEDLRAAIKTEKERTKTATEALDAKIGFTKNPRLDALLTIQGIIGDESWYSGGMGGVGGGRGGNRGGGPGGAPQGGGAPGAVPQGGNAPAPDAGTAA